MNLPSHRMSNEKEDVRDQESKCSDYQNKMRIVTLGSDISNVAFPKDAHRRSHPQRQSDDMHSWHDNASKRNVSRSNELVRSSTPEYQLDKNSEIWMLRSSNRSSPFKFRFLIKNDGSNLVANHSKDRWHGKTSKKENQTNILHELCIQPDSGKFVTRELQLKEASDRLNRLSPSRRFVPAKSAWALGDSLQDICDFLHGEAAGASSDTSLTSPPRSPPLSDGGPPPDCARPNSAEALQPDGLDGQEAAPVSDEEALDRDPHSDLVTGPAQPAQTWEEDPAGRRAGDEAEFTEAGYADQHYRDALRWGATRPARALLRSRQLPRRLPRDAAGLLGPALPVRLGRPAPLGWA